MPEFPAIHSEVYKTTAGTPYLKVPGVVMIARPDTDISGLREFLKNFDEALEFDKYLDDPVQLPPGEQLVKLAGQLCYASFGPKRTTNAEADKYLTNIKSSGHGSVLEHANFTFLVYGVSRSLTHELVRHRAGFAFSQISQRYVSGKVLRFVERPEFASDPTLHQQFEARIDKAAADYESTAEYLAGLQEKGSEILSGEKKRDLRKKVQQTARALLPNETEAPIVVTANVRAWRHVISMRSSDHAETEIREWAYRTYQCLKQAAPLLFDDFEEVKYSDGTHGVKTQYPKV